MGDEEGANNLNSTQFLIRQMIRSEVLTAMIVRVSAVDAAARTVDITPMVQQVTPSGQAIQNGTISEVPYGYDQGGQCQIKIDPAVGDIGVAVFAHRDITRVKRTQKDATPQTIRAHDPADALYVRTLWAQGSPAHQIAMTDAGGIVVTSSEPVKVIGSADISGDLIVGGDATIGGISFLKHVHTSEKAGTPTGPAQNG